MGKAWAFVMEEVGVKAEGISGVTLCALEGLWGALFMSVLVFPLLWFLPGDDHGHVEDFIDAFIMLKANWSLVLLALAFSISNATFTVSGVLTSEYLNSVHRSMIDSLRSAVVWTFGLSVYYF